LVEGDLLGVGAMISAKLCYLTEMCEKFEENVVKITIFGKKGV